MNALRHAAVRSITSRRAVLGTALAVAALASSLGAQAAQADPDPLSGVDLSTYQRVGRYDLPVGTGTNLEASEASGVAYDPDDQSLYVVGDEGTSIAHVDLTGHLLDSMALTGFEDTEGIAYVGGGQFVVTEERLRQVDRVTYQGDTTLDHADAETVKLGSTIGNIGLEGVSNDPTTTDGLFLVKETEPESIFATAVDWADGTATNGSPTTEATNLFPPADAGLDDFSDVFALDNLQSLASSPDAHHLLMISQQSGKIINIDQSGTVSSSLTIRRDADNTLSVPDQTMEGISMDEAGTLYVVSEQGGGVNQPQLWVYQPTTDPDVAPAAVALSHTTASLPEDANTTSRRKVADVDVTDDDGLGVNHLAVTGADAADFEVDATGLYLKAGVTLDHETKSSYSVAVTVDDTTVGATPDATSSTYTLTIDDVAESGGDGSHVVISEIAPWGSGNSTYAADWWELTNTGTDSVDLTGWKMDDSSDAFGSAVPLSGVSVLHPGQSAVFVEGVAATATAFVNAWFGGSPPAGLAVGSYTGSGVGLSTSGDAVVLFDALGNQITGVQFPGSTAGVSFDNSAGAGSTTAPLPTVSALTTAGAAGAFTANGELGSPGAFDWPVRITEVQSTGNSVAPYAADWFEVTNTGTVAVPLAGWKMDDNSHDYDNAVPLADVDSLQPGESAEFVEGDATTEAGFRTAWFGADTSLEVGSYTGSGVGLGAGGDEVNLFDAGGNHVTGVAFGAVTSDHNGVSFDNHALAGSATLPVPTIAGLSARGVDGAYVSGPETGSPGTIAPDTTAPVITFGGAQQTYALTDRVQITCAAADEARGSGLDAGHTTCADVDAAASDYGVGDHTITATATDYAGNARTASVTFTVAAAQTAGTDDGGTTTTTTTTTTTPAPATTTTPPAPAKPAPAKPKPALARLTSAKAASLLKGVTTRLTHLKARSKVTLAVRYRGKTIATIKATASASGVATVKVKLSKAQLAKLRGKTVSLRYTVVGTNGKTTTIVRSLKIKG